MLDAALGSAGVLLAFAASVAGIVSLGVGLHSGSGRLVRSGRIYASLVCAGAGVATVAMESALFSRDFEIRYVAEVTSRQTPLLYTVTGLWSSLAGSILLWGLVLALFPLAISRRLRAGPGIDERFGAWTHIVMFAVGAFFFAMMLGPANPFATFNGPHPANGTGPNPLLQDNVLVAAHPPLLYLGMVGFTVPFALHIAGLVTGRVDGRWQETARRWAMFAWMCLGAGIMLGAWWSYEVLGWGGFWAWDPVENAALMPWLIGAAYVHSSIPAVRSGIRRTWTASLAVSAFCLTILGTFLTRSGVVASVHAFAQSRVGLWILVLLGVAATSAIALIAWRAGLLREGAAVRAGAIPSGHEGVDGSPGPAGVDGTPGHTGPDDPTQLSPGRRGFRLQRAVLAQNVLLAALTGIILLGTLFPLLYQAAVGGQVTVGAPYFDRFATPIALMLLALMGVGPLLGMHDSSSGDGGKLSQSSSAAASVAARLLGPAWAGGVALIVAVLAGIRSPLLLAVYGLGAFTAAANLWRLPRQFGGSHPLSSGHPPTSGGLHGRRQHGGSRERHYAGLRTTGAVAAHLGIVVVAVALASASGLAAHSSVTLYPGGTRSVAGQVIRYAGVFHESKPSYKAVGARVYVDGSGPFEPALSWFGLATEAVGTPAIASGPARDVYITLSNLPSSRSGAVTLNVTVQPFVMWLWVGGALAILGVALVLLTPRRRRRPGVLDVGEAGTVGGVDAGEDGAGERDHWASRSIEAWEGGDTDSGKTASREPGRRETEPVGMEPVGMEPVEGSWR